MVFWQSSFCGGEVGGRWSYLAQRVPEGFDLLEVLEICPVRTDLVFTVAEVLEPGRGGIRLQRLQKALELFETDPILLSFRI